jgi:hypothetical protein
MDGKGTATLSFTVILIEKRGEDRAYLAFSLTRRLDFGRVPGSLTDKRAQQARLSVINYG